MLPIELLSAVAAVVMVAGVVAADNEDKPVGRTVHYSGKVQGVGFRATVAGIAKDHPVTGYVKNLDDGRVQVVVEGKEADVKKFLDAVRSYWKKNIEKEDTEETKPTGKYKTFSIMY
jgi:acylphosphatase